MKIVVLYRPQSDHRQRVEEFIHNFQASGSDAKLETLNIDSRDGSSTAMLYDITRYPAIMVLREDGTAQHLWQGDEVPLISEVESYLYS